MGAAGSASAPVITRAGDTNTGIFFPAADTIAFAEGGVEAMRLDSAGNLGLGVTPSAWISSSKAIQLNTRAALSGDTTFGTNLTDNLYLATGTVFKYLTTAAGTVYLQNAGTHQWYNTPSGTAGTNATVTQAMTLDASGNLVVGGTSANVYGVSKAITLNAASGQSCVYEYTVAGVSTGYFGGSSTATWIGSKANIPLVFYTNDTERARIDSSGNLLVGTTSFANSGGGVALASGASGENLKSSATSTGAWGHYGLYNGNGRVGLISTNGTGTTYATSSDYRLKENIAPMTGALATVAQLKPCTYTWKADGAAGQGFIAHELQAVLPDAVVGEKDAVDVDGNPEYQGIDTSFLVATLTAAIQEQQAIITQLQADVANVRSELTALKGQA